MCCCFICIISAFLTYHYLGDDLLVAKEGDVDGVSTGDDKKSRLSDFSIYPSKNNADGLPVTAGTVRESANPLQR